MKILLINPPLITNLGVGMSYGEPLGLAYIAAAIETSGRHGVEVLDAMGLATQFSRHGECIVYGISQDEVLERMRRTSFDAIGISVVKMYNEVHQIPALCALIKSEYPDIPLIAGGPEITLECASYMGLGSIDFAVLGEGEKTIVNLLDYLDGNGKIENIQGISYREDGQVKTIPQGTPADISALPWPARHLFPMENYLHNKPMSRRKRVASILTSRACPFSCAFCSSIEIWGRKWRGRPAKDVVDEIEHLVTVYGVREIHIYDDNFLVDRKRAEEIADGIIERKLDIALHIVAGLMMWLLSADLMKKMKKAGLFSVQVQLESGNSDTLKYIDKHIDISKAKGLVDAAHSLGLRVTTNVIIGFYFEDQAAIDESIRVAESIGFNAVEYILAEPKPRTRMYDDCVKAGIIKNGEPVIMPVDTIHFKGHELVAIRANAQQNNMRNRMKRILMPKEIFSYFIPMYIYNPGNTLWLMQRIFRKCRHVLAQSTRRLLA